MKSENFKEKFKSFCQRVGKRNFIIAGAVVLIASAVILNFAVFGHEHAVRTHIDSVFVPELIQTHKVKIIRIVHQLPTVLFTH